MMFATPEELQYQIDHSNDDRRLAVVASAVVCAFLAYFFVALRFLAHRRSGTFLKLDDWALFMAVLLATGQYISLSIGIEWGLGRHSIIMTNPINFGKNLVAAEIIYIWAIAAVKVAILLLWNRLFTSQRFRYAIWATGALVAAMVLVASLVIVLQCIPLEHLWNLDMPAACVNMSLAATVFGAINIVTDLLIIVLPIKQLMKLRLDGREKYQLVGLFLTGGLVTIISVARMFFTVRMGEEDVNWTYVDAGIWSSAEISAAIVSACLPTLRPLFGRKSDSMHRSTHRSYPSIGKIQRWSEMYQLRGEMSPPKPPPKDGASIRMAPAWSGDD